MNWLSSLMRSNMAGQMLSMMGMKQKRRNRNGLFMSLVSVGLGAVAYMTMRDRNNKMGTTKMIEPVQRLVREMRNPIS